MVCAGLAVCVLTLLIAPPLGAQTRATLQGRVFDASDAVVIGALITVRSLATGLDQSVATDRDGRYHVAAIDAGMYRVTATAPGFRSELIQAVTIDVGRTLVRDFRLSVGDRAETIVVEAELPLLDRAAATW